MTREKMLERWHKELENGYWKVTFIPQVYDYLEEKTDTLDKHPTKGHTTHIDFKEWIVKELDGDNAEMARRMLIIISKIRQDGLIGQCGSILDIKICLRIGLSFKTILEKGILRCQYFDTPLEYEIVELLIENRSDEMETFTDQLLTEPWDSLNKNKVVFSLAIYSATAFLKKDSFKYSRYLPALIRASEKDDYNTLGMLYYSYRFSPQLKNTLLERLTTDLFDIGIFYSLWGKTNMPTFLEEIGAPQWPYYYAVATNDSKDRQDKPFILNNLYQKDKTVFLESFQKANNSDTIERVSTKDIAYSLYFIAIMLHNGEGKELMNQAHQTITKIILNLTSTYPYNDLLKYGIKNNDFINQSVDIEKWRKFLIASGRYDFYDRSEPVTEVLTLLYEYFPIAKYFINLLFTHVKLPYEEYLTHITTLTNTINERKKWLGIPAKKSLQMLLDADNELTISDAIKAYCLYPEEMADAIDMEKYEREAVKALTNKSLSNKEIIPWLNYLYMIHNYKDYLPLINLLASKSIPIRNEARTIVENKKEELRPILEKEVDKLNGNLLTVVKDLLKCWENENKPETAVTYNNQTAVEFCKANYDKSKQKHIAWIPKEMLENIRFADLTEKAPIIVLQYIFSEYLNQVEPYRLQECDNIAETLDKRDLQTALENIYQYWLTRETDSDKLAYATTYGHPIDGGSFGADSKKKKILIPYCIFGSDSQILRLKSQIKKWVGASRMAMAVYTVNAIAINGGSVALMMIDDLSKKMSPKIRSTAKAAYAFAAKALNVSMEELSDRIVPTLGFSENGEKIIDYGARTFTVTLMPDFSLSIFDNDKQKTIKSMPSPGTNDDTAKATAGKKEVSEIKKQIKVAVKFQTSRLELFLVNGRRWNVRSWRNFFVKNPIMHCFATGLIWGVYQEDKLIATFRYMSDGTFNTVKEEEYTLPENATIAIVHPMELPAETLSQWKEQLNDYEVTPPIKQLTTPIVTLKETDFSKTAIIRYNGTIVKASKIASLANKYSMERGELYDHGDFGEYHYTDKYMNISVTLNFDRMFVVGQDYDADVTLEEIEFHRIEENNFIPADPRTLPARFVRGVMGMFDALIEE